jgi:hypothetical protein
VVLEAEVGERDRRRGERVGLDDVGAGAEECVVDVLDRLRPGQREDARALLSQYEALCTSSSRLCAM